MSRRTWLIISAIVSAYVIALILDVSPYVRGPDEWRWSRWPVAQWDKVWPLVVVLTLIAALVGWLDRRAQRAAHPPRWIALGVAFLIIAAPVVQLLALHTDRADPFAALFERAVDRVANSYFTASLRFDNVNKALRTYPQLMPKLDIHAQVHPPGLPLIYWTAAHMLETTPNTAHAISQWFRQLECNSLSLTQLPDTQLASALAGMLIPLLVNMATVGCMFKLAKDRFGPRAGLYAAALWIAVPSVVLFSGMWSVAYPCLACLTWLTVDAGLRRRRVIWFLAAGVLLSVGTFLELGIAALGLLLALYVAARYGIERRNPLRDWRFLAPALIVTLIGVFSIWIVYQLAYGVSLKQIIDAMYPIHVGYQFDRLTWLINHPYEFAVFVGLPVFCLLVIISVRAIKEARAGRGEALSASFLISLIVLALIDPARDETARTWMLFMPSAVVIVSQLFAGSAPRPGRFHWLWGLMILQAVTMLAVLHVIEVRLPGLPAPTLSEAAPITATATQADFGGMVQLIGYEIQHQGDHLIVDWYWRGDGQVDYPYWVFNHVMNDQWQTVGQEDNRPQDGRPLMTCWRPGDIYRDRHVVAIASDVQPGQYTLEMGLYNDRTGARVAVVGVDGAPADHLEIGPIELK